MIKNMVQTVMLVGCLILTSGASITLAEVASERDGGIILGIITEDSDPIGIWLQIRPNIGGRTLNPGGDIRGDGNPDILTPSIIEDTDPVGTWAYNTGTDHDIAFSEWNGTAWTPTVFLTSSLDDELDPRVAVETDGTIHIVWWNADTSKIYLATRPAGGTVWSMPQAVTTPGEISRRPSVTVDTDGIHVAYERDSAVPLMAQDVVVATSTDGGNSFVPQLVGSTARTDKLGIMIHSSFGTRWIEWMQDGLSFGCSEWQTSAWTPVVTESWTDPSWIGVEDVRKRIMTQVLADQN